MPIPAHEEEASTTMTRFSETHWRYGVLVGALCVGLAVSSAPLGAQDDDEGDSAVSGASATVDHSNITVDPRLWVLSFNVDAVKTITPLEGPSKGQVFWYMLYTVENQSDEPREAYISVTATSDQKKTYADTNLASVEAAVERKVGRPLWGKSDLFEAQKDRESSDTKYHYTTFAPREKRRCVAVFNRLDPGANAISITVRGLSNDFRLITRDDGSREIEERIYQIRYERPADEYEINLDRFHLKQKGWTKQRIPLVIPPAADAGGAGA